MARHARALGAAALLTVLAVLVVAVGATSDGQGPHNAEGAAWLRGVGAAPPSRHAAAVHGAGHAGSKGRLDTLLTPLATPRRLMASCNATRAASAYVRSMYAALFHKDLGATRPCLTCPLQQVRTAKVSG